MAVTLDRSGGTKASGGDVIVGKSSDATLLRQAKFSDEQQALLRKVFAQYAKGPTLSQSQLSQCLADNGCRGSASAYFAAFDRNLNKSWIDSNDFIVGVASLDPLTPHSGAWLAERARCIYRFYAAGSTSLSHAQLSAVIEDAAYVTGSRESVAQRAKVVNPAGAGPVPVFEENFALKDGYWIPRLLV
jgi:hypothetical protein